MLSFSISYWDLIEFPNFVDTTEIIEVFFALFVSLLLSYLFTCIANLTWLSSED
jgi:hypothetical protein